MARTFHHSRKFGKYGWLKLGHKGRQQVGYFMGATPSWYTRLYMNRPKRMDDRALLRRVAAGKIDTENVTFALGNHRPHVYFW